MRVVFPLISMRMSGGKRVTFQYINGLAQRGHNVTVLVPSGENTEYLHLDEGVLRVEVPSGCSGRQKGYLHLVWTLGWHIPACDVIVANGWQTMYPAMLGRIRHGARVVFLVQGHDAVVRGRLSGRPVLLRWRNRYGAEFAYRMPATRVAVSNWVAALLCKQYGRAAFVLPNGVDVRQFRPNGALRLDESDTLWVMVLGSSVHSKGYADALEAIRIARCSEPRIKMLLVSRDSLELPDDIPYRLIAPQDDDELRACYCASDLFLFTSHLEGFGLPPLEAMACGVPVVTTDCGGVRDFADREGNCLLVPVKQPKAQAVAILRLLQDSALRQRLAEAGRGTAYRFRKERAVEGFCEIIASLL